MLKRFQEIYLRNRILYSNPGSKSYSQFGEDVQISRLVTGSKSTYLDIGSGHPIIGNNTFKLYREKWSGILIEPIPELASLSKKVRPRDQVINAAIGPDPGKHLLYKFHPYQYSTTDELRAMEVISSGIKLEGKIPILVVELASIVSQIDEVPGVVSIDAEANDVLILSQLLDLGILPQVFCIEDFEQEQSSLIDQKMIKNGYSLKAKIYPTSIYLYNN